MRLAGHRAAVCLLAALPLEFEVKEAIRRVGPVMKEHGFVSDTTRHPACYYTIGLFEGFVHILSKTRVSIVRQEFKDDAEIWTLRE